MSPMAWCGQSSVTRCRKRRRGKVLRYLWAAADCPVACFVTWSAEWSGEARGAMAGKATSWLAVKEVGKAPGKSGERISAAPILHLRVSMTACAEQDLRTRPTPTGSRAAGEVVTAAVVSGPPSSVSPAVREVGKPLVEAGPGLGRGLEDPHPRANSLDVGSGQVAVELASHRQVDLCNRRYVGCV